MLFSMHIAWEHILSIFLLVYTAFMTAFSHLLPRSPHAINEIREKKSMVKRQIFVVVVITRRCGSKKAKLNKNIERRSKRGKSQKSCIILPKWKDIAQDESKAKSMMKRAKKC